MRTDTMNDVKIERVSSQPDWADPCQVAIPENRSLVSEVLASSGTRTPANGLNEALPPINPEDKRVVNGAADINQLAPFKYAWA